MVKILGFEIGRAKPAGPRVVSVDDLPKATAEVFGSALAPAIQSIFDGEKFPGGFGTTQLQNIDYWTLRARSAQLFNTNLYARGLIRRLITNEINTGLMPEAAPDETLTGMSEDTANDWSETVETRFGIWGQSPAVCDWWRINTWGAIQRAARMEAIIDGDVLVVLRQLPQTRTPAVQLVSGSRVQTPLAAKVRQGHTIRHGVETDRVGRVVAYHVKQDDGTFKRLPATGERSGRRIAWLVFGTEKRLDDVRGVPLLALILQSLKEIDRYRDSAQRKAVINSILAMFIEKTEDKAGTLPVTGGAVRKDAIPVENPGNAPRNYNMASQIPGVVFEELQQGEKPVGFHSQGIDIQFGVFEESIIQAVAWANEIPPEILRLSFSNNYSASQAAINEFKMYLNRIWAGWGEQFCTPIYIEFLISETLNGNITAPGLLESWRDPSKYAEFGAWVSVDWYGSIKPSTDMLKQAKGAQILTTHGWSTNARVARELTGMKFSKNTKRLKRENELLIEAATPLAEFEQQFGRLPGDVMASAGSDTTFEIIDGISNQIEDMNHG
jgi:lambda family phage portal protein